MEPDENPQILSSTIGITVSENDAVDGALTASGALLSARTGSGSSFELDQTGGRLAHLQSGSNALIGTTFAEKYEVLSFLGKGGMSVVYQVRHLFTGKLAALKVLHTHLAQQEMTVKRFRQEAQTSGALVHPGIMSVQDFGVNKDGVPYLVMDFIEGESLSDLLKTQGPLELDSFLNLMVQVSGALAYAHQKHVIHRDLKPSNIMVTSFQGKQNAKIVDFGIAKIVQNNSAQQLTQTGDLFGSPLYMSPEQCSGRRLDGRSDIYALGCVMYELLSGTPPHVGETILETINKHNNELPPPLKSPQIDSEVKGRLELLILKCLAKDVDERFQSASEIESELRSISLSQKGGVLSRLSSAWSLSKAKRAARKKNFMPLLVLTLAVSCLFSTAALLFITHLGQRSQESLSESQAIISEHSKIERDLLNLHRLAESYAIDRLPGSLPEFKATVKALKRKFDRQEKNLQRRPADLASFKQNRPLYEADLNKTLNILSKLSAGRGWNLEDMSLTAELRQVKNHGIKDILDVPQEETRLHRQARSVKQAHQITTIVLLLSCGLNVVVIISLFIFFLRSKRLGALAERASRLTVGKVKDEDDSGAGDDIAELDNVLQELASALSEAEQREKELLARLNAQNSD